MRTVFLRFVLLFPSLYLLYKCNENHYAIQLSTKFVLHVDMLFFFMEMFTRFFFTAMTDSDFHHLSQIILSHGAVTDCAVVGLEDALKGHVPLALCVLRNGESSFLFIDSHIWCQ